VFGEHQLTFNLREIFLTDDPHSELIRGRIDVVDKAIRKRQTIINITASSITSDNDVNRYAKTEAEIEK